MPMAKLKLRLEPVDDHSGLNPIGQASIYRESLLFGEPSKVGWAFSGPFPDAPEIALVRHDYLFLENGRVEPRTRQLR